MGGNKVRKLEFLMAEALQSGADCVITIGGVQSNHCRATAAAARYLGIDTPDSVSIPNPSLSPPPQSSSLPCPRFFVASNNGSFEVCCK